MPKSRGHSLVNLNCVSMLNFVIVEASAQLSAAPAHNRETCMNADLKRRTDELTSRLTQLRDSL